MRIRLLFICLPALALLAACAKTDAPVRLDFVGGTGLTSGSRTVAAGDTLVTHAYAVGNDQPLKRLHIEVTYEPGPAPILYPVPTNSFKPENAPKAFTLIYLDSILPVSRTGADSIKQTLFANGLMARTTSGKETWTYTVTDVSGQTAARGYHFTVHKFDSAAVFHSYPLVLRPLPLASARPYNMRDSRRVFLNLRYGLLLPRYALLNNSASVQTNQALIDLVCVANQAGTTVSLVAPADAASHLPQSWITDPRRTTQVHLTNLSAAQFTDAATTAAFTTAFDGGAAYHPAGSPANDKTTGPLATGQVVAFKAFDDNLTPYYGLLQATALTTGTNPVLTGQVKVQKY